MATRWKLRPHDPAAIESLSRQAQVPPLIAQLLLQRGVRGPAAAQVFVDPRLTALHDPETLPGAVEAAERIASAIRNRRKIVIYGDYDVDGVCGTSLLWACLRLAGARDVEYYIPHRIDEGYGLNAEALRKLATERGSELVVTVDCGISAVREAKLARELGLELIVTDHHTIGPEVPPADVVVHPRLPGSTYPFGELCGAGVAFKVAWQIAKGFGDGKRASPHMQAFLKKSVGLVALATIADVVPLADENRILVRHGLDGLLKAPGAGLKALMEVAKCRTNQRLSTGTVGFQLAPRINAAGRLECAMKAVELLTTEDETVAQGLAQALDECNQRRQELERSIVAEAHRMIEEQGGVGERGAIVLGKPGWHSGVIGIVAGRLAETYHRPAIVLAVGDRVAQGSARSIPGFDLYQALAACSEGLIAFGGHSAAAGLKMAPEQLDAFAETFDAHCRQHLTREQLQKELLIDAEVPLAVLSRRMVEWIDTLEPYGAGNPRPYLLAHRATLVGPPRLMGEGQKHVRLQLKQGDTILRAVGWNMADRLKDLRSGEILSVVFHPSINEWNGSCTVQLEIKDFRVNAAPEGAESLTHGTSVPARLGI